MPDRDPLHDALSAALAAGDLDEAERIAGLVTFADDVKRLRLGAPDALANAARWYAGHGIAVFPLQVGVGRYLDGEARGKRPLFRSAHPREADPDLERENACHGECGKLGHGLHDATTDLKVVQAWWSKTPQANIGLRTGLRFDVVDIDPPEGWTGLAELKAAGLVPEALAYAHTPSGGMHIYVAPSGVAGNAAKIAPGVDLRGVGGYVVAPPSRSEDGTWSWSTPLDPAVLGPA